jgi:Tfp pilus assembly ATPase PilU
VVNSVAAEALSDGTFDRLEAIMRDGEYYDMQTFDQSLLGLYRRGSVDREAALHHATSPPSLQVELEQVDRERSAAPAGIAPPVPYPAPARGAMAPPDGLPLRSSLPVPGA